MRIIVGATYTRKYTVVSPAWIMLVKNMFVAVEFPGTVMFHLNIRSVPLHFSELSAYLDVLEIEFKMMAMSETATNSTHAYSFVDIDTIMHVCNAVFDTFQPVSCDVLASIIHKLNRTTCGLDPFPTKLLMSHLSSIINIILRL